MAGKDISSSTGSEYSQQSFIGGMNLLLDDTHLTTNQYRIGFNLRNRYDKLDIVSSSVEDTNAPRGIKQDMATLGSYEILFVAGRAYYKLYTDVTWTEIVGFRMSSTAPRFWTKAVPVSTTNYLRIAATVELGGVSFANSKGALLVNSIAGAFGGNVPGLVVQDNFNQPRFIFIGEDGLPTSRITQTAEQWQIKFTDAHNTVVAFEGDKREYVPIGNAMEYVDGVLYIASQDKTMIYQSVTGRPLDFVRNVTNVLAGEDVSYTQRLGGDASTTAYSVGVGEITCLRAMADGSLFVAAGNANFSLSKNYGNNVPLEFGEFPLIRKFLFNANCLSDRAIFDTTGDTRFIDLTGVRSFNSVAQLNNEGRNSVFTATIDAAFGIKDEATSTVSRIIQNPSYVAGILYDNYELYAVNTIFGPAIAVYDTINSCWVGFDVSQTNGKRIKLFTKIEIAAQALFAVTEDDKVYQLYAGPGTDVATLRTVGMCANIIYAGTNIKLANPKLELQLRESRIILNEIMHDCTCSFTPYVNNRKTKHGTVTKNITFRESENQTTGLLALSDVDTQLENLYFPTPNCEQGWKVFGLIEWTGGSVTQFSAKFNDLTPMNPLNSQ